MYCLTQSLIRLLEIIYFANLSGGSIIGYLITIIGPTLNIIDPGVFLYFYQNMTNPYLETKLIFFITLTMGCNNI